MDKKFRKTFLLICLCGGMLFGLLFFLTFGAGVGYSWFLALLCFGVGMVWAVAFYFIWMLVQKKSKPFTFENPKAQAKLIEYEATRGIPYEQMLCAFMHYGAGLKQEVCEARIYFETEGIRTTFCHFGKIYSFDVPYQAVVHMSLEDERILLIQATDVGSLCFSVKETSPEQLTWITEKTKQFDNS